MSFRYSRSVIALLLFAALPAKAMVRMIPVMQPAPCPLQQDPLVTDELGNIFTTSLINKAAQLATNNYQSGAGMVGIPTAPGGASSCNIYGAPTGTGTDGSPNAYLGGTKNKGNMAEYEQTMSSTEVIKSIVLNGEQILDTHFDFLTYGSYTDGKLHYDLDRLAGVLAGILAHEYMHHCLGDINAGGKWSCKHLAIETSVAALMCEAATQMCAIIETGALSEGEEDAVCSALLGMLEEYVRYQNKWNTPQGKARAQKCKDCAADPDGSDCILESGGAVDTFFDCLECGVKLPAIPPDGDNMLIPDCDAGCDCTEQQE